MRYAHRLKRDLLVGQLHEPLGHAIYQCPICTFRHQQSVPNFQAPRCSSHHEKVAMQVDAYVLSMHHQRPALVSRPPSWHLACKILTGPGYQGHCTALLGSQAMSEGLSMTGIVWHSLPADPCSPGGLSDCTGSRQDTPAGLWRSVPSAQRMLARGMASKAGTTGNASAATRSRKGIIGGRAIILSSMCPYLALSTCSSNSCGSWTGEEAATSW